MTSEFLAMLGVTVERVLLVYYRFVVTFQVVLLMTVFPNIFIVTSIQIFFKSLDQSVVLSSLLFPLLLLETQTMPHAFRLLRPIQLCNEMPIVGK